MKYLCMFLFGYSLFIAATIEASGETDSSPHKIIYLISPPRSLSVALTRMMYERGDFDIFHEPSQYAYGIIEQPEYFSTRYRKDSYANYEEVKQVLLAAAEKRNVFAKEMNFAVKQFLLQDSEFI